MRARALQLRTWAALLRVLVSLVGRGQGEVLAPREISPPGTRPVVSHPSQMVLVSADTNSPFATASMSNTSYVPYGTALNYAFAKRHGYNFAFAILPSASIDVGEAARAHVSAVHAGHFLADNSSGFRSAAWCKLLALWHVSERVKPEALMWMDTDALFMAPGRPIHACTIGSRADVTISAYDGYPYYGRPFNSGVMHLVNDAHLARILCQWWDAPDSYSRKFQLRHDWEQAALKALFPRIRTHVQAVRGIGVMARQYKRTCIWHLAGRLRKKRPEITRAIVAHRRAPLLRSEADFELAFSFSTIARAVAKPGAANCTSGTPADDCVKRCAIITEAQLVRQRGLQDPAGSVQQSTMKLIAKAYVRLASGGAALGPHTVLGAGRTSATRRHRDRH